MDLFRQSLIQSAALIAATRGEEPVRPLIAFRKIFIQEKRDRSLPGAPQVGWKRGEIFEFLMAPSAEEWGDVGYYVSQTWGWLWKAYFEVTPDGVMQKACLKFLYRASVEIFKKYEEDHKIESYISILTSIQD
jgi:hypothetical protein